MPAAFHCRHHLPTISGGEGAGAALPLNPHYLHDHPLCPRSQPNLRDRNSSHEIGAILIVYEDLGYVPHNLTVGFNRDSIQESIDALSLIFCLEFNSNKSLSPPVSGNLSTKQIVKSCPKYVNFGTKKAKYKSGRKSPN